jgi:hypothetical protein
VRILHLARTSVPFLSFQRRVPSHPATAQRLCSSCVASNHTLQVHEGC